MIKICECCGNEFTPSKASQKYCSRNCYRRERARQRDPNAEAGRIWIDSPISKGAHGLDLLSEDELLHYGKYQASGETNAGSGKAKGAINCGAIIAERN